MTSWSCFTLWLVPLRCKMTFVLQLLNDGVGAWLICIQLWFLKLFQNLSFPLNKLLIGSFYQSAKRWHVDVLNYDATSLKITNDVTSFLGEQRQFSFFVIHSVHPSATSPRHKMSGVKWGDAIVLSGAAGGSDCEAGNDGDMLWEACGGKAKKVWNCLNKVLKRLQKNVENGVKSSLFWCERVLSRWMLLNGYFTPCYTEWSSI